MKLNRRTFLTTCAASAAHVVFAQAKPAVSFDALQQEFVRLEAKSGGRLGVMVLDSESGKAAGYRQAERFPMCSTFKALASAALLKQVEQGKLSLDQRVMYSKNDLLEYAPVATKSLANGLTLREACEAAVAWSDNTAANLVIAAVGGPAAITGFARSLGDQVTRLDRTEPTLNTCIPGDLRDTTSPLAMAKTIQTLTEGKTLSPASRSLLTGWMANCQTGNATLRAGLPKNWAAANKTGAGEHGTRNDIGAFTPPGRKLIFVAAYLTGADGIDADQRNAVLADVARAVATALA